MPAKNSIGKFHGRYSFINQKLWRKYMRQSGERIPYAQFKAIITASIKEQRRWILREPIGIEMPGKLGNIAINKFKTYGEFKTYLRTKSPTGKPILNFNLHTGGHAFKIQWFKNTRSFTERIPFWFFDATRDFKRSLAKLIKGGSYPVYNSYMQDHFTIKLDKSCKH